MRRNEVRNMKSGRRRPVAIFAWCALWAVVALLLGMTNGMEDPEWSYWGGRPILEPDGKYHLFVARWPEGNPRGHGGWPNSEIAHATSDRPTGPFVVKDLVGPGHFPEIHRLNNGQYVVYHFHGCYTPRATALPKRTSPPS